MRARVIVLSLILPLCLSWPFLVRIYTDIDLANLPDDRPDPRATLTKAVAGLRSGNYAFSAIYSDGRTKGVVHLPSRSAYLQRVSLEPGMPPVVATTRLDGPYRYTMTSATRLAPAGPNGPLTVQPLTPKRWQRATVTRFPTGKDPDVTLADPDVTGATELIAGVRTAEWGPGSRVFGTLDATGVRRPVATFLPAQIKAYGPAARSVKFAVSFDTAGRLARIIMTMPDSRWILNVTGYGKSTPQKPPSIKNTQDRPDQYYTEHS